MLSIVTSLVGLAAVGGYLYVAAMFARVSHKAGTGIARTVMDALVWPVMGWQAIQDLYKVTPSS